MEDEAADNDKMRIKLQNRAIIPSNEIWYKCHKYIYGTGRQHHTEWNTMNEYKAVKET